MVTNNRSAVRDLALLDNIVGTESIVVIPTRGSAKRILTSSFALRSELDSIRQLPTGASQGNVILWTGNGARWFEAPWVDEAGAEGIARAVIDGTYIIDKLDDIVTGLSVSSLENSIVDATEANNIVRFTRRDGSVTSIPIEASSGGTGLTRTQATALIESKLAAAIRNNTETGIVVTWDSATNTYDFVVAPMTGAEIVSALSALTGNDRLSYNHLRDLPTLVSDGDRAKLRRLQISTITGMGFDSLTNTLTLNYEDADGTADDTSVVIQVSGGGGGGTGPTGPAGPAGAAGASVQMVFRNGTTSSPPPIPVGDNPAGWASNAGLTETHPYLWRAMRTGGNPNWSLWSISLIGKYGVDGGKGDKGDKGDTGDTGPVGPTGPQGPAGTGEVTLTTHQEAVFESFSGDGWENVTTDNTVMAILRSFNTVAYTSDIALILTQEWVTSWTEGTTRTNVFLGARIPLAKKPYLLRYRMTVGSTEYKLTDARHVVDDSNYAYYEITVPNASPNDVLQAQLFDTLEVNEEYIDIAQGVEDVLADNSETIEHSKPADKVLLEVKDDSITPDKAKFSAGAQTDGNVVTIDGDDFSSRAPFALTHLQEEVFDAFDSEGWVRSTDSTKMGIVGPVSSTYVGTSIRALPPGSWQTLHIEGVHLAGTHYFAVRIPLVDRVRANKYRLTEPTDDAVPTVTMDNATFLTSGADTGDDSGNYAYYQVTWPEVPAGARVEPQIFDSFELDDAKVKVTVKTDNSISGDGSLDSPLGIAPDYKWTRSTIEEIAESSASHTQVAGAIEMMDGAGIGLGVVDSSNNGITSLGRYMPGGAVFDLDDNMHGFFQVKATFTLSGRTSTTIGFTEETSDPVLTASIDGLAYASEIIATEDFNPAHRYGVEVDNVRVRNGSGHLGTIHLYQAHNAANEIGYYIWYEGNSGSLGFTISSHLTVAFTRTATPNARMTLLDYSATEPVQFTADQFWQCPIAFSPALTAGEDNRLLIIDFATTGDTNIPALPSWSTPVMMPAGRWRALVNATGLAGNWASTEGFTAPAQTSGLVRQGWSQYNIGKGANGRVAIVSKSSNLYIWRVRVELMP